MTDRPAFARWLGQTNDVTRIVLSAAAVPDRINMAGGLPDPVIWPVPEFAALAERAVSQHAAETLACSSIEGLPALRDAIAARFTTDTLRLTRDNVLIVSGGMQALDPNQFHAQCAGASRRGHQAPRLCGRGDASRNGVRFSAPV
jgi:2-aminoadipate transaminase